MDRIKAMEVLVAVVDRGGFTPAADALGMTRASASKIVQQLEDVLGVRLLHRTTRRVSPTEIGQAYCERAKGILAELKEAEALAQQQSLQPTGTLRINAPVSFGILNLGPVVAEFMARHPALRVEFDLSDRFVDLVDEGYDAAIRIANLGDTSLVARRLATSHAELVAAPQYLKRFGMPGHPRDLKDHICLGYGAHPGAELWRLHGPDGEHLVRAGERLSTNNGDFLAHAAAGALGIALLPGFIARPHLEQGRIVPVMPAYRPRPLDINLVYPGRRYLSAKVRLFAEFMSEQFRDVTF